MTRQQTPDIMTSLMNGKTQTTEPANNKERKQENIKDFQTGTESFLVVEQSGNKTIELHSNTEIKQEDCKEISEIKKKATFNLSLNILQVLEETWLKLRPQLNGEERITKTVLVELALELAIKEFEALGSNSTLYKKLIDLRSGNPVL